ncbi:MAG: hypothetical protein AAGG68_09135 [Bacteroidota bacterium]
MKNLFFIALALLCLNISQAQDFYLPVSTKSEIAKAAYYKMSQAASMLNFEVAEEQFTAAIEADPNFFMAYVLNLYYSGGEERAALIDKALAIDVSNFNEAEKIVRQHLVVWDKDPKAKIGENMKALVAAYPTTPEAYMWAALHAGYTDGDNEAAIKYAEKVVEFRPDLAPIYNVLGYAYMDIGQMDKAKVAFEKQIALSPKQANPYDSMADYYVVMKDYAKAAENYDKAAALGLTDAKERADEAREKMK